MSEQKAFELSEKSVTFLGCLADAIVTQPVCLDHADAFLIVGFQMNTRQHGQILIDALHCFIGSVSILRHSKTPTDFPSIVAAALEILKDPVTARLSTTRSAIAAELVLARHVIRAAQSHLLSKQKKRPERFTEADSEMLEQLKASWTFHCDKEDAVAA